jgi:hypothetical protein
MGHNGIRQFSLLILLIFLLSLYGNAQNEQWCFGKNAGLDFSSGTPVPFQSSLFTNEGCASISDSNGDLLFYSDGIMVWNKNHQAMSNSIPSSPGGSLWGDPSSTQSAYIIPKPLSNTEYYIFVTDANSGPYGLTWNLIDMTLDSGLGDIGVYKNQTLFTASCEKITAIRHANQIDFWLIGHHVHNNEFAAYHISSSGVNYSAVVSSAGFSVLGSTANLRGYMKGSPNGDLIAVATEGGDRFELFAFDNNTGVVSLIATTGSNSMYADAYGVEFSANQQYLYGSRRWGTPVYQWDISSLTSAVLQNPVQIATLSSPYGGALQYAPDGKIYIARSSNPHLSVINFPEQAGLSCQFSEVGVNLLSPTVSKEGLPSYSINNAISSFLNIFIGDETCLGSGDGIIEVVIDSILQYDSLQWWNGTTGLIQSGLAAGSYSFDLYYNGISMSTPIVEINLSDGISYTLQISNPSSLSPLSGAIDLSVISGQSPYIYQWSNGFTGEDLINIPAGNYSVTIIDDNYCSIVVDTILTENLIPSWNYQSSLFSHDIDIPFNTLFQIGSGTLDSGDYIGVFYDSVGTLACAGYVEWPGNSVALTAHGNSLGSNGANGFAIGEEFKWKVWKQNGLEYYANAIYHWAKPDQEFFVISGLSGLTHLIADSTTVLDYSVETTNNSCIAVYDGSASITNLQGAPPYNIIWSTGDTVMQLDSLPFGAYGVSVSDQYGYILAKQFEITMPDALITQAIVLNSDTAQNIYGSIILSTTGGTSPYSYLWFNGITGYQASQLSPNSYMIQTTDQNGCSVITTHQVTDIGSAAGFAATGLINDPLCLGSCDGSISISTTFGASPYSYLWSTGDTTQIISNLCEGNYEVTVIDANATFSNALPWSYYNSGVSHVILVQPTVTLSGLTLEAGDMIGVFFDNGGVLNCGGYAEWNGGVMGITAWGDDATTSIKDGFALGEDLAFKVWKANTGNIYNLGVTYNPLMPTQGFYSSSGMSEINSIFGSLFSSASYQELSFTLTYATSLSATSTLSDYAGYGTSNPGASDGFVQINSVSGNQPILLEWSTGISAYGIVNLDSLEAGLYSLTLTDSLACTISYNYILTDPPAMPFELLSSTSNISCYGYSDGNINLTVSGGVQPYHFSWSDGSTAEDAINVESGLYEVTVTDSYAEHEILSFYLSQPDAHLYLADVNDLYYYGSVSGSIVAYLNSNPSDHTYLWSNGDTLESTYNLGAGIYELTITSPVGCDMIYEYELDYNDSIIPAVAVNANLNQFIEQMMIGDCGNQQVFNASYTGDPFSVGVFYSGSSGFPLDSGIIMSTGFVSGIQGINTSGNFSGNTSGWSDTLLAYYFPGVYIIQDAASIEFDFTACQDSFKLEYMFGSEEYLEYMNSDPMLITITGPAPPGMPAYDQTLLSTVPGTTTPVGIQSINHLSFSSYYLNNAPNDGHWGQFDGYTVPLMATAAIVPCETYHVKIAIADGSNALHDSGIFLKAACDTTPYSLSGTVAVQPLQCFNDSSGTAAVFNLSGTPPYLYEWSNGAQNVDSLSNISAGSYQVTVWDADHRVVTIPFQISQPDELVLTENIIHAQCYGDPGSIELTATGGTTPYSFSWSNGLTNPNLFNVFAGNYSLTVIDGHACSHQFTYTITEPDIITHTTQASICDGETYSIGGQSYTVSGLYYEIYMTAMGCDSTAILELTTLPLPAVYLDPVFDTLIDLSLPEVNLPEGFPAGGIYFGPGVIASLLIPADAGPGEHTIYYEFTDSNGCSNIDSVVVNIQIFGEISGEAGVLKMILYPNPAREELYIKAPASTQIQLINTLGQRQVNMLMEELPNEMLRMDISHLPQGVYVLEMQIQGRVLSGKVVKY